MVLIPDHNLGFFVNYYNEDADSLREDLVHQFLEYYFPVSLREPIFARPDIANQLKQFVGIYRPLQADESTFFKIAWYESPGLHFNLLGFSAFFFYLLACQGLV